MTATFLHTADWQLGKPFAGIADAQKRSLVQQERLAVLDRIADEARQRGAEFILVAGDLFDSPSATKATVAAACSAIGRMALPVLAIPGNHDHGGPGSLWEQEFFKRECAASSPNFRLLLTAEPVELETAIIFPCPLLRRAESTDPTAWLRDPAISAAGHPDKPRILLAHGSVQGFGGDPDDEETAFAVNRIDLTRLPQEAFDYVALGDWHGTKEIAPETWYSGTPEPDRFPKGQTNEQGHVLSVRIARRGPPQVDRIATGRLRWHQLAWEFTGDDSLSGFQQHLADALGQRAGQDLLRLELSGTLGIAAGAALEQAIESWEARLLRLKLTNETRTAPGPGELAALTQRAGDPLISRVAAHLAAQAAGSGEEAALARLALRELHTFATPGL
jgi:DNA repair exonuclease SbcCD nuclease subunit